LVGRSYWLAGQLTNNRSAEEPQGKPCGNPHAIPARGNARLRAGEKADKMLNAITTTENQALTTTTDVDPFLAFADAVRPQHIIGKLLKHSKGEFLAGEDSESLPAGTKMVAAMDWLTIGFVHWSGGKPDEHRMVLVASGERPPRRVELGDIDPASWEEKDASGAPRDPWQLVQYLPMIAEDSSLFTFSTGSRGGIGALAALARQYARGRAGNPDKFPVVELLVDSYQHSNSAYGRIKVPKLKLVGWEPKITFLTAAGLDSPTCEGGAFGAESGDEEMSDSIPF
jgi:hypothetical protein